MSSNPGPDGLRHCRTKKCCIHLYPYKVGPLPVVNGVITRLSRVLTYNSSYPFISRNQSSYSRMMIFGVSTQSPKRNETKRIGPLASNDPIVVLSWSREVFEVFFCPVDSNSGDTNPAKMVENKARRSKRKTNYSWQDNLVFSYPSLPNTS